jgi:O-antigen ligase
MESGLLDRDELEFAGVGGVFRPVSSHVAFYVAAVGLVQTMAWLRGTGTRRSGWHSAVFMFFVLIMQHRSTWVAAGVGLACVLYLERRHLPRRFPLALGFALVASLVTGIAGALGYLDDMTRSLAQSVMTMSFTEGTLAGRIDGWDRLLSSWWESSMQTILLGYPFGRGYMRLANTEMIGFSPHNFYVDLVLRVGVIGMLLFLIPTCMAIARAMWLKCDSEFEYLFARGVACGLIAALVYCMAYPSFYLLTAAAGAALAYIAHHGRSRRSPSPPRQVGSLEHGLVRPVTK